MARRRKAREEEPDSGEVKPKDFERVEVLYREDIRPAKSEAASQMQICSEAAKVIKKECHVRPDAARAAFKAFELEDVHRDDFIEGFVGTFNQLMGADVLTYRRNDLFGAAGLATLQADDEDGFEASEEEIAKQKPRADAAAKRQTQAELAGATVN